MEDNYTAKLWVNDKPVALNPFVEQFLSHISIGAAKSLKGIDNIHNLEITEKQHEIEIKVDDTPVPLIFFPMKIIASTLHGLASTLKGVDEINMLRITVHIS